MSPVASTHPSRPAALALFLVAALPLAAVAADRVLVSDVIVQGSGVVPAAEARNLLETRPGREFLPEVVREDVRRLYATRKFANVYADKQADGLGRTKVIFTLRDHGGAVARVTYLGADHLGKDELDKVAGIRVGSPLSPVANKVACQKIVARYAADDRPFTTCTLAKGANAADGEVIFHIAEGPKVKVRAIGFTGNDFVGSAVLRTHIQSSTGPLGLGVVGGAYNAALIDADAVELVKYYRALGFLDVRVARELRYSADGRDVTVVFHVAEGPRYRLESNPRVLGARKVPPERLAALVRVKAGDLYDQRKIDRDLAALRDYFGYMGYDVRPQAVPVYARETPGVIATLLYEVEQARPPAPKQGGRAP